MVSYTIKHKGIFFLFFFKGCYGISCFTQPSWRMRPPFGYSTVYAAPMLRAATGGNRLPRFHVSLPH